MKITALNCDTVTLCVVLLFTQLLTVGVMNTAGTRQYVVLQTN